MESACTGIVFTPAQTRTLSVIIVVISRELAVARCCCALLFCVCNVYSKSIIDCSNYSCFWNHKSEGENRSMANGVITRLSKTSLKHPEASWSHIRPSLTTAFLMFHPGLLVRHRRPRLFWDIPTVFGRGVTGPPLHPEHDVIQLGGGRLSWLVYVGLLWFTWSMSSSILTSMAPSGSHEATCYKAMQLPCPCNWKQWRP